ncbi:MAG: hypothetical protein AAGI01_00630 [Myxococcota bacterium]
MRRLEGVLRVVMCGVVACSALACRDIPPPDNEIKNIVILKDAIFARVEHVGGVRFKEVVLEYFDEQQRIKVRQLILAQEPDELRVQTKLPGTEELVSVLVSNGERFAMHQRDSNTYYTGRPTREHINELLPLDLSASDVVRVMLGGAPWERFLQEGSPETWALRWDGKTGRYDVSVKTRAGGSLSMQVRHEDFAVVEVRERGPRGRLIYAYTTKDWRRYGTASLPEYRRFVWPAKNLDFSLDVGETQVGVSLPESLFNLPAPAGSEVIDLGD